MTDPTPISLLADLLKENDYSVVHVEASDDHPADFLLITADLWDGMLVPMRIQLVEDLLALAPDGIELVKKTPGTFLLHASALMPFTIDPGALGEVMQAAFLVNRLMPVAHFGVSIEESTCYITSCIAIESFDALPERIALDTIGMACHGLSIYGPLLKKIAAGQMTCRDLRADLATRGTLPPPVR